jgi:hypothetical protein
MAGIFAPSKEFAILTRQAIPEFMSIHDRMPVIIPRQHMREWLVGSSPITAQTVTNLVMLRVEAKGSLFRNHICVIKYNLVAAKNMCYFTHSKKTCVSRIYNELLALVLRQSLNSPKVRM